MYSPVPQSPQLSLQLPAPLPSPYASPAYGRPTYPVGAPSIIGGGGSVTSAIGGSSSIVGGAFGGSVGGAALGPAGSASIAGGRIGTSGSVIGSQSILGGAGSSASVVSAGGLLSAANGGTVTSLNATNQQNTTIDNLVDTISNTSKILGRANYAVDHKDCYNLINNLERELQKRHFESKELNDELLRRQKRILELESLLGIKAHTSTTTSIGATHSQHQQDIYGIGNASYGGVNSSFLGATHNALSSSQLSTTSSQYGSPPRYGNAGLSAHYSPTAVRYNVNDYDTAKRLDASDGVLDGTLKGSSISVQGQSLASGYGAQSSAYGAQSGGYSTQASGYGQSSVGYGPNSGYSNASTFVPSTPINNNTTISRPTTSVHYNTNDPQLARKLDASDGVLDGKLRGAEIQVRGQPYTTTTTTTGGASSSAWSTTPTTTTVTTGAPIKSTYYVNDPEMARKLDARDGVYDGKLSGSDIKVR